MYMLFAFPVPAIIGAQTSALSNKVFTLRHIPAHQAKKVLADLSIGRDINCMVDDTVILFTADNQSDIEKASAILKVIDSKQKYSIVQAAIKPDPSSLPNIKEIDASFEGLSIGTFKHLPKNSKYPMAILDMHKSNLIIIAPENRISRIRASVCRNREQKQLENDILQRHGSRALPNEEALETRLDGAIKELLVASENPTVIETHPELETFSKSLAQSTGPKSQSDEREMEVTVTVGDKQKTTRIKDGQVVEQVEGTVEKAEATKEEPSKEEPDQETPDKEATDEEKPEFEPLDEEMFAELIKIIEAEKKQQPPKDTPEEEAEKEKVEASEKEQEPKAVEEKQEPKPVEEAVEEKQDPKATEEAKAVIEAIEEIEAATIESVKEEKESADKKDEPKSLQPEKAGKVTLRLEDIVAFKEKPTHPIESQDYIVNIPIDEKERDTVLNVPTEIEITDLLEMMGKLLGVNYIYDPLVLKNKKIMLKIHDGKIKIKDLYALVETALRSSKLVMTRRGNLVRIVAETDAASIDPVLRKGSADIQPGDIIVGTIFKLNHISTDNAMNFLRNMKLGTLVGGMQPIPETGTLIVIEYAHRMPRVAELLKMIDVKGEPKKFASREMKFTSADVMSTKIQTLAEQLGTVQITIAAAPKTPTKPVRGRPAPRTPTRSVPKPAATKNGKGGIYLDVDERTNRILMIGLVKDLQIINELIDSLDVPKRDPRRIERYKIEHVETDEVMSTLNSLGIISYSSSRSSGYRSQPSRTTSSRTTTSRPGATTNTATTSTGAPILPGEEPQIVALTSTNSLLVNATDEQHEQIVLIIEHVDREEEASANPYVIYRLENKSPEEMAEVLDKIVNATLGNKSKGNTTSRDPKVQTSTSGGSAQSGRPEDVISIVPDESTFSLIVYASRKNQEQIGRMILELDKRRPQVLIDVTLVEIFKNEDFQYDLEIVTAVPDLIAGDAILPGMSLFGTPVRATQGYKSTGDTFTAFYADNHIQSLLTLMQTKEYGRVLSQPKLLVNDGEAGTINQEKTIYIARSSSSRNTNNTGDASIVSTSTQFDNFPSGISMSITPNIGEGDLLRLEIELNRSQQDSPAKVEKDQPPPDKKQQDLSTIVTVPDKSTIILGGINELSQSKDTGRVPILSSIPVIGVLFQNQTKFDKQAHLYVFVKAYILRPEDGRAGLPELTERSNEYRREYEKEEKKFHDHNWGSIKKTDPMPPMTILKDD